jgi:hypothetical protein
MLLVRSLLAFSFALGFVLAADDRCDNGPCKVGCCNDEGWCGFGPDCMHSWIYKLPKYLMKLTSASRLR